MPFKIIFMDAGQGDATLVVYPDNSLMLVDCGCKKNIHLVQGEIEQVLDRYLPHTKNKLKALVLTHPDGDHYNLVEKLVINKGVEVETLVYGSQETFYGPTISEWMKKQKKIPFCANYSDDVIFDRLSYLDSGKPKVEVRILAANAGDPKIKTDANTNSVVLLITYLDINIFLMGDATAVTEKFITNNLGPKLDVLLANKRTVLKAGHHGSNSSSSQDWIEKIKPEVVFISSDTKTFNGVSIPRSGVIQRIKDNTTLYDLKLSHSYVQYNDATNTHEEIPTELPIFTTLHKLEFEADNITFTAHGTSWYYEIDNNGIASFKAGYA